MICYWEQNLSFCTLNGVWGDDFHKVNLKLEKEFILFLLYLIFLLLLFHIPQKAVETFMASPWYKQSC